MKRFLKSKLVLSLVTLIMIAAAFAVSFVSGSITHSHATAPAPGSNTLPTSGTDFLYQINETGWSGFSQTSDTVNGWGDDQWQIALSSTRSVSIQVVDCCIVGDNYEVYVDSKLIGTTPPEPLFGSTYSQGTFTTTLTAGSHLITIRDPGGIYYYNQGYTFMIPAGYSVTISTSPAALSLGEEAAQLAKSVVGAPYLGDGSTFGGKGYDWTNGAFVGPDQIKSGYNYYNNVDKKVEFGAGLDCAGLIFWAYNKAFGATHYQSVDNPIYYEGADGQYAFNSKPISKADLQLGDLLFFSYDGGKSMHHVAMYVGGDDAVEAANTSVGIILSKVSEMITRPDFFSFGRRTPPVVAGQIRAHSPISLVVTDPDGYTINDQTVILTGEERLREVPRQLYYSEWNIDQNGRADDTVTFPNLKTGNYFIKPVPKPGALPTDVYSLDIEVAGQTITLANNVPLQDIPSLGYGIQSTGSGISVFIPVSIDIKPGSSVNSINPGSKGKIPVAIFSSATFNAPAVVNKTSLTFGHTGNEPSLSFCNVEDVNGDGLLDLICLFNTQQTGFKTGDVQGVLKGQTLSGIPLWGADSVNIVP